jgi:hypothetical protein
MAEQSQRQPATKNVCKTRGYNYRFWAPDDGRCVVRNMLSNWETLEWLSHCSGNRQPKTYVKPEAAITVFELLMMSGVLPETCWAIKKHWNNKFYYTVASCWSFLWDLYYDARIHEHKTYFIPFKSTKYTGNPQEVRRFTIKVRPQKTKFSTK